MHRQTLAALALLALTQPSLAHTPAASSDSTYAKAQFATILSWEGRWNVAETDALQIVFEVTARGTTVLERWEAQDGLHSITVYHLDGDRVISTHYCPQGNQPRLESVQGTADEIAFGFRDVTDLDEGESHSFTLNFQLLDDGSIKRTDVYHKPDGLGKPSSYTMMRAPTSQQPVD